MINLIKPIKFIFLLSCFLLFSSNIFSSNTFAQPQNLQALAPAQNGRERAAIAELNGKIYLFGGILTKQIPIKASKKRLISNKLNVTTAIECYDPQTNQWKTLTPLPIALYDLATVTIDNKIYIIGGYNVRSTPVNTVYCYDLTTEKITKVAPLPISMASSRAVALEGKIYVVGGKSKLISSETFSYDPKANTWKKLAPMSTAHQQVALSVINGKLLVAGGKGIKNLPITTFEEYDAKANIWQQLPPLPIARFDATAAVLSNKFYLFGGQRVDNGKFKTLTHIDFYDPLTNIWANIADLATPINLVNTIVIGKQIYFLTSDASFFTTQTNQIAKETTLANRNISDNKPIKSPAKNDDLKPAQNINPLPSPPPLPPISSNKSNNKAPSISPIPDQFLHVGEEVRFTVQVTDPENDRVTISCNVPPYLKYRASGNTIYLKGISDSSGSITCYVVARDSFGNQTREPFEVEVIENHAPFFDGVNTTINTFVGGQTQEIAIQARDADASRDPNQDGLVTLSLANAPDFVDFEDYGNGSGKLIVYSPKDLNYHNGQIIVEARDFGNPPLVTRLYFTISVTKLNLPPVITPISNVVIHSGERLQVPVNIYDPDGDYVKLDFRYSDWNFRNIIEYVTGQLIFRPRHEQEGRFSVTLIATDTVGNQVQESFYVTVVANHPPTIENLYDIEIQENAQPQKINITASDIDHSRDPREDGYVNLRLIEQPAFVDFRDDGNGRAILTVRPRTGDSGVNKKQAYKVTLEAKDNGNPPLKYTKSFNITVVATNNPPIIRGLPDKQIVIRGGEQYCVDFSVTDPDNDSFRVQVTSDYQQYINAGSGAVCVTPPANFEGRIVVTVIATDSKGKEAHDSFTVRSFINHKPSFDPIQNISVEEKKPLELRIHASDPDSQRDSNQDGRLDLNLVDYPRFINFRNDGYGSATLLINPELGTAGNYSIEVVASDNGNPKLTTSLRFQLTVLPTKELPIPIISSAKFEDKKLVVLGSNFIDQSAVEINGLVISQPAKQTSARLVLTGRRKDLNLHVGQNTIVVINGDKRSSQFTYHLEKNANLAEED